MLRIEPYQESHKQVWNKFIEKSKNGTFLFYRDYMEYHQLQFKDASVLFYDDEELISVLPANREQKRILSHGGLTYGGLITGATMTVTLLLQIFDKLMREFSTNGLETIVYKPIPHIYQSLPSEEDLYALFRFGAKLIRRDVSSALSPKEGWHYADNRKRCIQRAKKSGLKVTHDMCRLNEFWPVLEANLMTKYGVKPTHSLRDMELLSKRFPDHIKLFCAEESSTVLAGVVIYETPRVAHVQYIGSTDRARELGAVDLICDYLISNYYKDKKCFDFGISTEYDGKKLNEGLIHFKAGFGARAVVYDWYELSLYDTIT